MAAALTLRVGSPPDPGSTGTTGQVVGLVQEVMAQGAALGWSGVPTAEQATTWWQELLADVAAGRAAVSAAYDGGLLLGLGEWRRYPLAHSSSM